MNVLFGSLADLFHSCQKGPLSGARRICRTTLHTHHPGPSRLQPTPPTPPPSSRPNSQGAAQRFRGRLVVVPAFHWAVVFFRFLVLHVGTLVLPLLEAEEAVVLPHLSVFVRDRFLAVLEVYFLVAPAFPLGVLSLTNIQITTTRRMTKTAPRPRTMYSKILSHRVAPSVSVECPLQKSRRLVLGGL